MSAQPKPRLLKRPPCVQRARVFEQTLFIVEDPFAMLTYILNLRSPGKLSLNVADGGVVTSAEWETNHHKQNFLDSDDLERVSSR